MVCSQAASVPYHSPQHGWLDGTQESTADGWWVCRQDVLGVKSSWEMFVICWGLGPSCAESKKPQDISKAYVRLLLTAFYNAFHNPPSPQQCMVCRALGRWA